MRVALTNTVSYTHLEYHAVLQKLLAAKRKSVRAESEYELNGKLVRFALKMCIRDRNTTLATS